MQMYKSSGCTNPHTWGKMYKSSNINGPMFSHFCSMEKNNIIIKKKSSKTKKYL